jgi:hypothetical protein
MTCKVEKIIRTEPRDGIEETPVRNRAGKFVLAHSDHGGKKHHEEAKEFANTLEEVVDMIGRGYHVRMGRKGKSPSMIAPDSLRIVWA